MLILGSMDMVEVVVEDEAVDSNDEKAPSANERQCIVGI